MVCPSLRPMLVPRAPPLAFDYVLPPLGPCPRMRPMAAAIAFPARRRCTARVRSLPQSTEHRLCRRQGAVSVVDPTLTSHSVNRLANATVVAATKRFCANWRQALPHTPPVHLCSSVARSAPSVGLGTGRFLCSWCLSFCRSPHPAFSPSTRRQAATSLPQSQVTVRLSRRSSRKR